MAKRREALDIKLEHRKALQAKLEAIQNEIADADKEISPEMEERIARENEYLGAIARVLVADDTSLKRRFVQQASKFYSAHQTQARRNLERVLGKIPLEAPIARNPAERDAAE